MQEFRGHRTTLARFTAAGRMFELLVPADPDQLMETPAVVERFEDDEYLPCWAQVWPAGLLLAEAVAEWPPADARTLRVLELGCGLGLVSLVLIHLGCRVLATDYDEDALAFVAENARRNRLSVPELRLLDWRETQEGSSFDRIVAADVLYETRHLRPVAELVRAHLEPAGLALIADPNRQTADDFDTVARHCDLTVDAVERRGRTDGKPIRGRIFNLRRRA